MAKEPYRVQYHVVATIYLERGRELSGPDFARLWSGMSVFGKHRAGGGFWHEGTDPGEQRDVDLGSLELVEPLLERGARPIFGGGTCAHAKLARGSTLDCDFYYEHGNAARWEGCDTRPHLFLSVSGQWFERTGVEVVLEKMKEHFDVADRYAPPYGLIDVSASEDCYAGMVYGATFFLNSPLHRWVEQTNWVYAGSKRRDKARGIYWGNYFGAAILDRLGGRQEFLARFREQARFANGKPNARVWEFPNGVFVSLCLDPLGCKPGPPLDGSAGSNLLWLVRELGSRGVLCAWSGETGLPHHPQLSKQAVHTPPGPGDATVTQVAPSPQRLSKLNEAEIRWIKDCVANARVLARKYCEGREVPDLDPSVLDAVFDGWLRDWKERKTEQDPNPVINAIGLAFGQWLVDSLGMQWTVVSDDTGTDMGVGYGHPANRVLVFPTHLVAKRVQARETGFLEPMWHVIKNQISELG
jgi:hypothetical protein